MVEPKRRSYGAKPRYPRVGGTAILAWAGVVGTLPDGLALLAVDEDTAALRTGSEPVPVLEIGGTHVTAALVDTAIGRVVPGTTRSSHLRGEAPTTEIVHRILACARGLAAPRRSFWGIALPGPCDYARGITLFEGVGKFDSLYGFDLGRTLIDGLPGHPSGVTFVNDADAFLLGEWAAGAAAGHDRAVGITLGTGIGSSFLARGSVIADGVDVPPGGSVHRLSFGGKPLEDTVSRRAVVDRFAEAAHLAPEARVDVREIASRARAGDVVARRVLTEAFSALGQVLGPWLARFHATVLVVGGSMSRSWDLVARPIWEGVAQTGAEVRPCLLTPVGQPETAALLGAALHVVRHLPDASRPLTGERGSTAPQPNPPTLG